MFKHPGMSCVALIVLAMVVGARTSTATINDEPFSDPAYIPGNALSAANWNALDDTTGALTISGVADPGEREVTLTADGLTTAFPALTAKYVAWGGPGRTANAPLWFAVDINKGSGTTGFVWSLAFARQNSANFFVLDGGFENVRVKGTNGTLYTSPSFTLADGWNRVVVLNNDDATTNGGMNLRMYLNGAEMYTFNATAGPLVSNSGASTYSVSLARQARGGSGDPFAGTMQFDNIITADEALPFTSPRVPEPATLVLLGLGGLLSLRRRG